jgi:hypothetical protein
MVQHHHNKRFYEVLSTTTINHYYLMVNWCSNNARVSQKGDPSGKLYSPEKP